ncbi:hypothetical protein D3C81_2235210 [compost metagenome]
MLLRGRLTQQTLPLFRVHADAVIGHGEHNGVLLKHGSNGDRSLFIFGFADAVKQCILHQRLKGKLGNNIRF